MKLVLIAMVLTISVHVEAASRCHLGHTYWCHSTATAQDCQKTQFCQDNDWKANNLCDICRETVNILKPYVNDQNIEKELKEALAMICDTLPGSLGAKCYNMVKYFDLGWIILKQEIESGGLCDIVQACQSSTTRSFKKSMPLDGNMCDNCKMATSVLKPLMDDQNTKIKVKTALENACVILADVGGDCYSLMESFDLGWEVMKEIDGNDICIMLKVCTPMTRSLKKSIKLDDLTSTSVDILNMVVSFVKSLSDMFLALLNSVSDAIFGIFRSERSSTEGACDMCKASSIFMKSYMDVQSAELNMQQILSMACGIFSGSSGSICSALASNYDFKNNWWGILKEVVHAGDISCDKLDVCASPISSTTTSLMKQVKVDALTDLPSDVLATLKTVFNSIETFFSSTFNKLVGVFNKPSMSEDDVCGICKITVSALSSQNMDSKTTKGMPDAGSCDTCRRIVNSLKPHVERSTEPEIRASLEKICNLFHASSLHNCSHLVSNCFRTGMENVKQIIKSGEMCTKLELCQSSTTRFMKMPSFDDGGSNPYQMVFTLIKNFNLVWRLMSPFFDNGMNMFGQGRKSMERVVEAACQSVPGQMNYECKEYIETYTPKLIDLLNYEVNPAVICSEIKLCSG